MLGALKAAAKKEATANPTKTAPAGVGGKHHHHHHHNNNASKKDDKQGGASKKHHHHHHHHHKKKKKPQFEEEEAPLHHVVGHGICSFFLTILHGINGGCGSIITCGICFDRYSEKQEMVEPEDEHDMKCQPDTKVLSWITMLVVVVGIFAYAVSISFEELPMYVRAELFNKKDCELGTIAVMEYVPTATCIKWKKQSLGVKKRPAKLKPGESGEVVQSGRPPKKPESVVYTFTEHYMWGLSWYADMYENAGCVSQAGVPDSIAQVEADETGTEKNPLYYKTQVRNICLPREDWDYEYKSARLLGSRCLGNHQMTDVLGMYSDPKCESLVKAFAYNLTFFIDKKSPKNTDKWEECTRSEIDSMWYKRVIVTPECSSKYNQYGDKIEDNSVYTNEPDCDSELECPDENGKMVSGSKAAPIDTPTVLIIVLFTTILPCLLGCVFYSMTCHEVQKKIVKR